MSNWNVGIADNAAVAIDDGPSFRCFDGGQRWNGAVCPRFSRYVVESVIAWMSTEQDRHPSPEAMTFAWDGDTVLITEGAYVDEPGYSPMRVEPDGTGRYQLAPGWVWSLAPTEVHVVRVRDARAEAGWSRADTRGLPVVRTVAIGADCPRCGGPRGLPRRVCGADGGRPFVVDAWTNPCGHVDIPAGVLVEAGLR